MSKQLTVHKKGYTRSDGTHVKASTYKMEDRGLPGRSAQNIPPESMKKYALDKHGYKDVMHQSANVRHSSLESAVKDYGKTPVIRKLNAVYVLNRNTNPELAEKVKKDEEWVRENVGESSKKSVRKVSKKSSRKSSQKGSKKSSKKSSRKGSKKSSRKSSRKGSKKSSRKHSRK